MIMCTVMLATGVGLIVVHSVAFARGDVRRLFHPYDHDSHSCGLGDLREYPYVYYPAKQMLNAKTPTLSMAYYSNPKHLWGVCTKQCPTAFSSISREGMCPEKDRAACTWYADHEPTLFLHRFCIFHGEGFGGSDGADSAGVACRSAGTAVQSIYDAANQSLSDLAAVAERELQAVSGFGANVSVNSASGVIARNLSNELKDLAAVAKTEQERVNTTVCADLVSEHDTDPLADFITDLLRSWRVLLISSVVSLGTGALYLLLICYFASPIIWGSVVLSTAGFFVLAFFLWTGSIQLVETGLISDGQDERWLAVICWIISGFLLLLAVGLRQTLMRAVTFCSATSGFLKANLSALALPQFIALLELLWITYWLISGGTIMSLANVSPAEDVTKEVNRFVLDPRTRAMLLYHIFFGLWVLAFFEGLSVVSVSITVSDWYFAQRQGQSARRWIPRFDGLQKAIRFHTGSVAFGSLVLAVVQMLKLVTSYIVAHLKKGRTSTVVRVFQRCVGCLLWFFEKCIRFVNFNAYLMIGVTGDGFCGSALHAFSLVSRNPLRFVVFQGVMWMINAIGRLTMLLVTILVALLLTDKSLFPDLSPDVRRPWPALIAVCALGYYLSGIFATVYTTSGSALFYCFVVDEELAGSEGRDPGSCGPLALRDLVETHATQRNKKHDDDGL
eukprot:CAMPEP_0194491186 /NCGR_PEP_ID=MMETSP0253-20130528/10150_1 /TAXON_ID=2966 /ORGANISM="Noctiluca scintillans" /LENGTH=673 /DNA_ID=CAMNT_0039331895 /DNA_START=115 /DNA_END=2136 /DNA_ORIENTATION=+